ncbi:hypothetical protein [Ornithinibacillus contaminans]|uniref:hypothetical protein n=1 Tax=Ornithinibacillus contaminans TaxID=694055 RepID=UPI00064DEF19|nr:hypothetical protein [Ornithinibacillus contaminans]
MYFFRGDVHKLFLSVKDAKNSRSIKQLKEVEEIKSFYESLDRTTLQLLYYRMIKEQNGMGAIPIFVTAIPWLLFLFSSKIQDVLFRNGNLIWAIFVTLYLILLTVSVVFHFRERAWAAFHIEVINDILHDRVKSE